MNIKTGADILRICAEDNCTISEVALKYEIKRNDVTEEYVVSKTERIFHQMKKSIEEGMKREESTYQIQGKMFKDYGMLMDKYINEKKTLLGDKSAKAVAYAVSVMEVNCSMGRIVASPTAGSCGVLPAALMSVMETYGFDDQKAIDGLLTAGLVGAVIGRNASLSGAQGGCQAEIGSAAAMSAAAAVEMAGGTPKMALDAASITLKNIMGLVCDPVAGLVEIPCVKRNGLGVLNALMSADMVLAGIESIIPFDEVVTAMAKIGRQMPVSLRETSEGGIADTPTARKLENRIFDNF